MSVTETLKRTPEERNAALSVSLDSALATQSPAEISNEHMINACAMVDAVAESIAQPDDGDDSPNDGSIRDSEGLIAWVGEKPRERARAVLYLALMAETGRISEAMRTAGISLGVAAALRHRHPVFAAAEDAIRKAGGRRLVDRGRETVEDLMGDESPIIRVKSAGLALQYGPREAGNGVTVEGGGGNAVQININLGECAPPPAIPMEQVAGSSLFIPSR